MMRKAKDLPQKVALLNTSLFLLELALIVNFAHRKR